MNDTRQQIHLSIAFLLQVQLSQIVVVQLLWGIEPELRKQNIKPMSMQGLPLFARYTPEERERFPDRRRVFGGMLGLAAIDRFRLTPAPGNAQRQDANSACRALGRSLMVETAVAMAILGLVAWLGTLAPPMAQ